MDQKAFKTNGEGKGRHKQRSEQKIRYYKQYQVSYTGGQVANCQCVCDFLVGPTGELQDQFPWRKS
ncbi:hypothetical protein Csa_012545 [Cucumis sativus]|uniref:Uncharacterized protein n=1 Tax=Cucumis sativus TaxID=3659 RepID=A0A0A0L2X9_CUCSA|nr:hypothetical protein Csa_012545 [Cucumis sativus]